MTILVRTLDAQDAAVVARLCGELGYPSSEADILARIQRVRVARHAELFGAERADGLLVAMMHVHEWSAIHLPPAVEIVSIVVSEGERTRGYGHALMAEAERWARARDVDVLFLSSRDHRRRAHSFYEDLGFSRSSTSHKFSRSLRAR